MNDKLKNDVEVRYKTCAINICNYIYKHGKIYENDLIVYRNMTLFGDITKKAKYLEELKSLPIGAELLYKSLISTTLKPNLLYEKYVKKKSTIKRSRQNSKKFFNERRQFKKNNFIKIKIPKGTKFIFLNFQNENEILLLPGKLKKIINDDPIYNLYEYKTDILHIQDLIKK
jgi:hypothetical protein